MDIGLIFLLLGIGALVFDFLFLSLKDRSTFVKQYINFPLIVSSVFIYLSFGIFISSLIFLDFSYEYAVAHTSSELDIFLRIASTWSGQVGSYYVWAIFVFTLYIIYRFSFKQRLLESLYQRMFIIIAFNAIALFILVLINEPFKKIDPVPTVGIGLNPVLSTFWNVIHPPIILLSYSLFLIPFSVSLARLSLGKREYNDTAEIVALRRFGMSVAWLVITIGLALGGYWAYETLGWGGFWAWDPVETSSLVPWLFATVFFHNSPATREKLINYDKDFFAILPFFSVLFATLVTRSGFLDSVHTFVSTPLIIGLEIYMLIIFFTILALIIKNNNIQIFYSWEFLKKMSIQDIALYIAYLSILLGAVGILFGLVIPFGIAILPEPFNQSLIVNQKFFNTIIGIFGFISLLSTLFMDFMFPRTLKLKFYALYTVVILGLFLAVLSYLKSSLSETVPFSFLYSIFGFLITTSYLANVIIPLALFSIFSAIIGTLLIYKQVKLTRNMKIRRVSQATLHIGILIALIGALYSSNLTTNFTSDLALDEEMFISENGSLKLKFVQTDFDNTSSLYTGLINNKYKILRDGNKIAEGWIKIGDHVQYGWYSEVSITPTIFEDIYIIILFSTTINFITGVVESLMFQVQIKPMIWLLWLGIGILILSMIPIVVISFRKLKNQYNFSQKMESTLNTMSDSILN